jgi:hypothetical protein
MERDDSIPSRRDLLSALTATPIAAVSAAAIPPWQEGLTELYRDYGDDPIVLHRSEEGRNQSRFRYHNAESFFESSERGLIRNRSDLLYWTGVVMQLGLSSHLLDVGFSDEWCKHHVGLRVAKSLAYANATGFDCNDPDIALLAAILTPYGNWRNPMWSERHDGGPFTASEIIRLARALLDHVRRVTGHDKPMAGR